MKDNGTVHIRWGTEGQHTLYYALPEDLGTPALGEFLKVIRQLRKYSLRGVAKAIDSSHGYLSHIESGEVKSEPTLGMLKRLADHYDIHTDVLLLVAGLRTRDGAYR